MRFKALAAAALLSACAAADVETQYRRADAAPGASPTGPSAQAWLGRDLAQCDYELAKMAYSAPQRLPPAGVYSDPNMAAAAGNLSYFVANQPPGEHMMRSCMRARGWQAVN